MIFKKKFHPISLNAEIYKKKISWNFKQQIRTNELGSKARGDVTQRVIETVKSWDWAEANNNAIMNVITILTGIGSLNLSSASFMLLI